MLTQKILQVNLFRYWQKQRNLYSFLERKVLIILMLQSTLWTVRVILKELQEFLDKKTAHDEELEFCEQFTEKY